jgi:hypothetical protein
MICLLRNEHFKHHSKWNHPPGRICAFTSTAISIQRILNTVCYRDLTLCSINSAFVCCHSPPATISLDSLLSKTITIIQCGSCSSSLARLIDFGYLRMLLECILCRAPSFLVFYFLNPMTAVRRTATNEIFSFREPNTQCSFTIIVQSFSFELLCIFSARIFGDRVDETALSRWLSMCSAAAKIL